MPSSCFQFLVWQISGEKEYSTILSSSEPRQAPLVVERSRNNKCGSDQLGLASHFAMWNTHGRWAESKRHMKSLPVGERIQNDIYWIPQSRNKTTKDESKIPTTSRNARAIVVSTPLNDRDFQFSSDSNLDFTKFHDPVDVSTPLNVVTDLFVERSRNKLCRSDESRKSKRETIVIVESTVVERSRNDPNGVETNLLTKFVPWLIH